MSKKKQVSKKSKSIKIPLTDPEAVSYIANALAIVNQVRGQHKQPVISLQNFAVDALINKCADIHKAYNEALKKEQDKVADSE